MWNGKHIAVVVPAYNESKYITETLETIPNWVDSIYAINDFSTDNTLEHMQKCAANDSRITVINHKSNTGVGGAIISGYKLALENNADIYCVMDGDGQMNPEHLHELVDPVSKGECEMAKGNRLYSINSVEGMPKLRLIGSIGLTLLTKIATGLWNINDPQNGYVAISRNLIERIPLDKLTPKYDFQNDFLCWAAIIKASIKDFPIKARYRQETSTLSIHRTAPRILITLWRCFFLRIKTK